MRVILLVCLTFNVFFSYSQSIKGKVRTVDEKPVEFTAVRLYVLNDSSVVTGIYTDSTGNFKFQGVSNGTYYLKFTYSGFETKIIDSIHINRPLQEVDLGVVVLEFDKAILIDEIVVSGSLDALKAGIDKKIYSISEDISVKGGSVVDAMKNIPSIDVDQDGNISLRGDGNVTILIDGRPSALALGDGKNLLAALPANSIERIEVVTNPSAKYDPDGTSGIINIVLKKNKLKGLNGIVSITGATGNYFDGNFSLGYRNQKWNAFLNYSGNYFEGYRNNFSDLNQIFNVDSSIHLNQTRLGTDTKLSNSVVLGLDFQFNDLNVVSISGTGTIGSRTRTGNLENRLYDGDENLFRRWNRASEDPEKNENFDLNSNYSKKLKEEKGEFSVNANYSSGQEHVQGYYQESYFNLDGSLSSLARLNQQLDNKESNEIFTFQTDFNYVFKKIKARAESGIKSISSDHFVSTHSETKDTVTETYLSDTLSNFDFKYRERIYSAYGIFGQEFGKFKYQVGIRGEYAEQTPELISTGEIHRNIYQNIFPSAHLKYNFNKVTEFSISYSKRINRARSGQLNPFTSYADPFNLRSGNPELQPEYIDSYDFGLSYTKKKVILSLATFHRRTSDVINRIKVFYPNNVSVVTFDNIDNSISTGFEAIVIYKPSKQIKNTISFNANYIDYRSTVNAEWNNDGFNWSAKYIASIDFWKNSTTFQLNAQYKAPMVRPQGIIQPRAGFDASIEKRFLNNKFTLGVRVSDIFNQQGFIIKLKTETIQQDSEYKWLTRRFYATLTYRFGKFEVKNKIKKESYGGEE